MAEHPAWAVVFLESRCRTQQGQYEAVCTRAEFVEFFKFGRSGKLILQFEIDGGEYQSTRLYFPMTAFKKGEKVGIGSKLYAAHLTANGGKPLGRCDRLSINVFKQRLFQVRVNTVRPRFEEGMVKPERFHDSLIAELLERLA